MPTFPNPYRPLRPGVASTPAQPAPAPAPAAAPAPDRTPYTGQLGAGVDTGAGSAQNTTGYAPQLGEFDPNFGKSNIQGGGNPDFKPVQIYRDGSGQLTTQSSINGMPLQPVNGSGAPLPPPKAETAMGQMTPYAPLSSSYLGGDPNNPYGPGGAATLTGRANTALQTQGAAAQLRGGPQINTSGVNLVASGAGQSLGQANGTDLLGLGNAGNLAGTATGAGYQGTMGAADRLSALGQMPAGPSVAQQQLQQGGDAAMQQQMAMAAGARGGNAGLALQNAGANQGAIMGNLNAQMGIQRAQEDMANRQFAANATQAAGGMYGQGAGIQQQGFGAAGAALGNIAGNQVQQGQVQAGIANTYAGMAGQQLGADMNQRSLNDSTMLASQGMGYDLLNKERAAQMMQEQNQANENIAAYGINKGVDANAALQKSQQNDNWLHQIVGGTVAAGGAIAAPFTGGASLAVEPLAVQQMASSDIRAKKSIKPASAQVSDAFRAANASADAIRGADVQYPIGAAPAYSYEYKNPNAPGAAAGTHYGPMAQDLEKTPAGASVVVTKPNGTKGIDTSRLALLNTSELAKQRAELDALKSGGTAYDPNAYDLNAYDGAELGAPPPPPPQFQPLGVRPRAAVVQLAPSRFAAYGVPGAMGAGY